MRVPGAGVTTVTIEFPPEQVRLILRDIAMAMAAGTAVGVLAAALIVELIRGRR